MLGRYKGEVARVAEPVARAMVGLRLRPNQLSCLGLVGSVIAAAAFAADQRRAGAVCLALAGALDILDGAVARASGQVSPFGAFLDSVLDRYSDLLVLAGLVFLFARLGRLEVVVAVLLALIGTVMVSYTRARAESVGVECRVGLMERGERHARADRRGPRGPPGPRDLGGRARGERDGGPPDRAHLAGHPRRPALIGTVRRSLLIHWRVMVGGRSALAVVVGTGLLVGVLAPRAGAGVVVSPSSLQRYREAHAALAGGEYARARTLLDELPPEFLLADYAAFFAAEAVLRGGDEPLASPASARSPSASRTPSSGRRPARDARHRLPAGPVGRRRARGPALPGARAGPPGGGAGPGPAGRGAGRPGAGGGGDRRPPAAVDRGAGVRLGRGGPGESARTWRRGAGLVRAAPDDRGAVPPGPAPRGRGRAERGRPACSRASWPRARSSPVRHRALARLAPMLGRLARSDEAIARLDAALTEPVTPSRAALLYELGRLLQRSGQTGRGGDDVRAAARRAPGRAQPGRGHAPAGPRARRARPVRRRARGVPAGRGAASRRARRPRRRAGRWPGSSTGPAGSATPRSRSARSRRRSASARLAGLYWAGALARPARGEGGGPGALPRGAEPRPARVLRHPRRAPRAGEGPPPPVAAPVKLTADPLELLRPEARYQRALALGSIGFDGFAILELETLGRDVGRGQRSRLGARGGLRRSRRGRPEPPLPAPGARRRPSRRGAPGLPAAALAALLPPRVRGPRPRRGAHGGARPVLRRGGDPRGVLLRPPRALRGRGDRARCSSCPTPRVWSRRSSAGPSREIAALWEPPVNITLGIPLSGPAPRRASRSRSWPSPATMPGPIGSSGGWPSARAPTWRSSSTRFPSTRRGRSPSACSRAGTTTGVSTGTGLRVGGRGEAVAAPRAAP